MQLLLTSNGIDESFESKFLSLIDKKPGAISVAFVTTAAYGEGENIDWLLIYKQQLQRCGITDIEELDIRHKTQEELGKILIDKDILFINGGNSFFLLDWVKKSGFDNLIKDFIDEGKLYVGASAGSIICCPTIESASWEPDPDKNNVGMTDFSGLHFVDFLITPHFNKKYYPMI